VIERGVPKFGIIDGEPVFILSENNDLSEDDLGQIINYGKSMQTLEYQELPVVFKKI
jgi:hypothetical protein